MEGRRMTMARLGHPRTGAVIHRHSGRPRPPAYDPYGPYCPGRVRSVPETPGLGSDSPQATLELPPQSGATSGPDPEWAAPGSPAPRLPSATAACLSLAEA